jgi:hypothetical protein
MQSLASRNLIRESLSFGRLMVPTQVRLVKDREKAVEKDFFNKNDGKLTYFFQPLPLSNLNL